ncbi:MAG: HDOD domain-containing protein [Thiotrichaceae bacterium]|nr:HDOD domain-containing protein [Thiotrichaceae bacterium]
MTPQQLAKEVENLFSLPEIYFQVKKTIDHPKSTIEDVANVISQDPSISARILRIANSSFFGFGAKIEYIDRAISIMGLAHLHNLVLAVSATNAFKGINSELFSMKDFWLHSIYCAAIAQILARKCNILDSERLFVSGILHDIGHLVIYSTLSTHASTVLSRARNEQLPLEQLETEIFGFNYAEVGGELLKQWQLPTSLYLPVRYHTHLQSDENFAPDSAIIHLANIMVLRDEHKKTGFVAPNINPLAFQLTELNEEDLEPIKAEAKKNMADIIKLFFAK